jgi:hypothetical protein
MECGRRVKAIVLPFLLLDRCPLPVLPMNSPKVIIDRWLAIIACLLATMLIESILILLSCIVVAVQVSDRLVLLECHSARRAEQLVQSILLEKGPALGILSPTVRTSEIQVLDMLRHDSQDINFPRVKTCSAKKLPNSPYPSSVNTISKSFLAVPTTTARFCIVLEAGLI